MTSHFILWLVIGLKPNQARVQISCFIMDLLVHHGFTGPNWSSNCAKRKNTLEWVGYRTVCRGLHTTSHNSAFCVLPPKSSGHLTCPSHCLTWSLAVEKEFLINIFSDSKSVSPTTSHFILWLVIDLKPNQAQVQTCFKHSPWIYWPQLVKQLCKKKKHFGVGCVSNSVPGAPYCLSTLPYHPSIHPPSGVGFLHKNPSGLIDFQNMWLVI